MRQLESPVVPVPWDQVRIDGRFWGPRLETNRRVTLPIAYGHCESTGRIDAFRLDWSEGQPNQPHIFWDSDVAKWLEASCYSLATHPDPDLRAKVDHVVDLIVASQQPDGYLNSYFTQIEPEQRWTNLRDRHELYCAGHLMEAAVAHHRATGERRLLDCLSRYADCIETVFGRGEGQLRGYPGHEEIELALVKLHRATGEPRYLELSRFFVEERGQQPHYYDEESRRRGEEPRANYDYNQSHVPVRDQATAEGHAVRAVYLYSAMADLVAETGDELLWQACRRIWANVVQRRMYLTGGIGSSRHGERFTTDYDLPNETAYAETCAAIGLVFWAQRMLRVEPLGEYADVMERALYNGVLSGVNLAGDRFFYDNPLAVDPDDFKGRFQPERQEWFGCACCPVNLVRILASLGGYLYQLAGDRLQVNLFMQSEADLEVAGQAVRIRQETDYPWDGTVTISIDPTTPSEWTLAVRWPGWCREAVWAVNGEAVEPEVADGFVLLRRTWRAGDRLVVSMAMPVEQVTAHPAVAADVGRVALQRGPLVYCLESTDNGRGLDRLVLLGRVPVAIRTRTNELGRIVVLTGWAERQGDWGDRLYRAEPPPAEPVEFTAIPYALWQNRGPAEMRVWLRRG